MEYEKVFASVGVVVLAVIAYFSLLASWNADYGAEVGMSANSTYAHIQELGQAGLFNLSVTAGNSTIVDSGGSQGSTTADLGSRALSVITSIPTLLGLVPALLRDFASILGIPPPYVNIAVWLFIFTFCAVLAYLLLIGARRML